MRTLRNITLRYNGFSNEDEIKQLNENNYYIDLNGEYNVSIINKMAFGNITMPFLINILPKTKAIINKITIRIAIKTNNSPKMV